MIYIPIYLLLINAAAFLLMLEDKQNAIKKRRRIPERTLIGLAFLGGSIGAIAGMVLFRHKTRHPIFFLGLPLILCLQIVIAVTAIYYLP